MSEFSDGPGVVVSLVGDVVLNRPEPASAFDEVRSVFSASDIRFGNCEAMYSVSEERHPLDPCATRAHPDNFEGVIAAGFDVMSFANNHALGGGYESFFDTLGLFEKSGIKTVGAGNNLSEALEPVIITRDGVRVAFLAFACVYYPGFEATATRPGVATLSVYTIYQQEVGQPGTQPIGVITVADPRDKAQLQSCVERAKAESDAVIVSMHWGIHHTEAVVADYERELARAAIDAGADLIFGHHQHILKGIDLYKGVPIIHGANQFIFDMSIADLDRTRAAGWTPALAHDAKRPGIQFDPQYPTYPFRPDARFNLIAQVRVTRSGVVGFHVKPCQINALGQPVPLLGDDDALDEWLRYMSKITEAAGLNAVFDHLGGGDVAVGERAQGGVLWMRPATAESFEANRSQAVLASATTEE